MERDGYRNTTAGRNGNRGGGGHGHGRGRGREFHQQSSAGGGGGRGRGREFYQHQETGAGTDGGRGRARDFYQRQETSAGNGGGRGRARDFYQRQETNAGNGGGRGRAREFYRNQETGADNGGGRGRGREFHQHQETSSGGGGRGRQFHQQQETSAGGRGRGREFHQPEQTGADGGGVDGGLQPQPENCWSRRPNITKHTNLQPEVQTHPLPDIGSLKVKEQPEESPTTRPIRRPDKGGTEYIRKCKLHVNHFPVTYEPEKTIMHYDVDVKPTLPPRNNFSPPKKISKFELSLIRNKLLTERPLLLMTAYDGGSNIYSASELPEETLTVEVSRGEGERTVSYTVTIKLVNKLELRMLRDYIRGGAYSIPRDILQGMDLVVKENPTRRTIALGRRFFPTNPTLKEMDLTRGVIAIGGFHHSLKTTAQGLSLCLDYSVLPFSKKMPVLDFLVERINNFNLNQFEKFRKVVEKELVGLKVNVIHRFTKQKYTITGLTREKTRDITFLCVDQEGQNPPSRKYLTDYFREKHSFHIKNTDIPALVFGGNKANYMPMELCVLVEGQRYPTDSLDLFASTKLKNMSLASPKDRKSSIELMMTSPVGPRSGDILQNFGMDVIPSMTNVTGRVIAPPILKLGDPNGKSGTVNLSLEKCHWNLVGKSMVDGKPVEHWGILDFTSKGSIHKFNRGQFVKDLKEKYKKLAIDMKDPILYEESEMKQLGDYNSLSKLLERISQQRLQFLLCVMDKRVEGYKRLKWIAETKVGIVTQCCLSNKSNPNKGKDQYLTNLALKINAKIGGSNVELLNRIPHFENDRHVMFIGADVNHPGSQDIESPSIAAVVATINWPAANRYAARVFAQERRMEKILHFGRVCLDLVTHYAKLNKARPEKIVIFRDGVSESQFYMVLTEELKDLKTAFESINYSPSITLIVAQKRHQTRLFPVSANGVCTGNVFPGTVVDTDVVHPFEFDFYLCSHNGSLGTSKPTHYHVLWDENKFSSDDLQKLIYNLCFTFARCTKPVSLVPPVYYADLAAYRGRLYYEAKKSANRNDELFSELHPNTENMMFFV
ncbi:protein argonaute 2-like [Vicia villosa]|uniref:protein argonaute 2-like n=1 Tax=Vicia villosa TaxID=3911 RepID=UPI00273B1360|nr:protein argonaute 2-like [Vicia villosa]